MRLFLAFLVTALAAGGALAIYGDYDCVPDTTSQSLRAREHLCEQRPTWAGPVALVVVIAGIGGGVAIAASGRR